MFRLRVASHLAWVLMMAGVVYAIDRVAMHTVLDEERHLLANLDHRPEPDGAQINPHGLREARPLSAFRERDFNIVVLGDSYVFGYKLPPDQTIPRQLERVLRWRHGEPSINVVNFGYVSASPYLSLRQLRDFGRHYHPDAVLLCLDMTDFHDDIKWRRYREKPGLFALLDVLPSGFFLLKELTRALGLHEAVFGYPSDRFFVVNRPLEESRRYLASTRSNIDATHAYVREELGARFALVVLPRPFQYSAEESPESWARDAYTPLGPYVHEPFRYLEEGAESRPYPVHSLLPAFRDAEVFPTAFPDDPHWNTAGARIAAEGLAAVLEAEGMLPGQGASPR